MNININIKPFSINQAWQGRRYKTKKYKQYEEEALYLLPKIKIPKGKLKIQYTFFVSNARSDVDNFIKAFQDILQKKYSFEDNRIYELIAKKVIVKKGQERIEFKLEALKS